MTLPATIQVEDDRVVITSQFALPREPFGIDGAPDKLLPDKVTVKARIVARR